MPRTPRGGPNGRPRAKIDQTQFETMCRLHASIGEVCAVLQLDDVTLNAWCRRIYGSTFSEVSKRFQSELKISMRRKMVQQALDKDNVACLIFWAKNHLGMADNVEVQHSGNEQKPVAVKVVWQSKEGEKNEPAVDNAFFDSK